MTMSACRVPFDGVLSTTNRRHKTTLLRGQPQVRDLAERRLERLVCPCRQRVADEGLHLAQHLLCNRPKLACALRQEDLRRARIGFVDSAFDQAVALERSGHRRQRLLAEASAARQLALPQSVLLVERDQQRSICRTNFVEAGSRESLVEDLVPALTRLRQKKAEVVQRQRRHPASIC